MKKKILLASLFGTALIFAIVGLSVDKVHAGRDIYDKWNETGDSQGIERTETVTCTITTTTGKPGSLPNASDSYSFKGTAVFCDCSYVVLSSCKPQTPCL